MTKLKSKTLALTFLISLVLPVAVRADENNGGTGNTTIYDSSTTEPNAHPESHKHHKHKKTTSNSTPSNASTAPSSADSRAGTVDGRTQAPGMSNSIGSNNAGEPNMGSPDHVPGTTGTSGQ